ncbi:hypothetical protein G4B88_009329 [Cannabis sativa]|uniref:Uncharacterized protein n=1 Tax=Cannabis sativa TaxID=3483 RepID=A0A7J6FSU6_CANSA|nr:hypothetical protein G4B88_009329 [Cannabis sativa]
METYKIHIFKVLKQNLQQSYGDHEQFHQQKKRTRHITKTLAEPLASWPRMKIHMPGNLQTWLADQYTLSIPKKNNFLNSNQTPQCSALKSITR